MRLFAALFAMFGALSVAGAQDHKTPPQPQKEHEYLKQFEGQWTTVSRSFMTGQKAEESQGNETGKMDFGGYWLVIDFKGEHMGKAYQGSGTMGYDPRKSKYVLTWIDNMSPYAMWAEGDADSSGKTFTMMSDSCDPESGKAAKMRTVFQFQDADHRTLTFYTLGKDGPDRKVAEIQYTRKK